MIRFEPSGEQRGIEDIYFGNELIGYFIVENGDVTAKLKACSLTWEWLWYITDRAKTLREERLWLLEREGLPEAHEAEYTHFPSLKSIKNENRVYIGANTLFFRYGNVVSVKTSLPLRKLHQFLESGSKADQFANVKVYKRDGTVEFMVGLTVLITVPLEDLKMLLR